MSRSLANFCKTNAVTNIRYRTNERMVRMPENVKCVRITNECGSQGNKFGCIKLPLLIVYTQQYYTEFYRDIWFICIIT